MISSLDFTTEKIVNRYDVLLQSQREGKYLLLYATIKSCILGGEFPLNWELPSTRSLSVDMNLSRTTVIKAYDLLILEKLIYAKAGSGYRVNYKQEPPQEVRLDPEIVPFLYPEISQKGTSFVKNSGLLYRNENALLAFKPGLPPMDIFPIKPWKNLLNQYWRYVKTSDLSFNQAMDSELLKLQICNYLHVCRNIQCDPKQVVIVSGSLQSIYLINSALIDAGDKVVLENPTFPNVKSLFRSSLADIISAQLDDEGIDLTNLDGLEQMKGPSPKIVHVTPSNHYPLGVRMSLQRRNELVAWASKHQTYIIENDYENEIGNIGLPLPSIFTLDQQDRTIYLGTFNRLLYPSIRLGFMILPKHLIPVVESISVHSHRIVSHSLQTVMGQFIEKNWLYKHLKNLEEVAQERHRAFMLFVEGNDCLDFEKNDLHGLHMVANFVNQTDLVGEKRIIQSLENYGISAHSLSDTYMGASPKTGLILGYATVDPVVGRQKVNQLLQVVSDHDFI